MRSHSTFSLPADSGNSFYAQASRYDGDAIIGGSSPEGGVPSFIGDGRLVFAPVEDLLFGFALVLLSLSLWVFWGRRGIDRTPKAGPPVWRHED